MGDCALRMSADVCVCVCVCSQVEISRNYSMSEWREDLKRYCRRAGAENKPCVFLFSDTQVQIAHDRFAIQACSFESSTCQATHACRCSHELHGSCSLRLCVCVCVTQIKMESFVEDINNLLNSGEVPNMFPHDERAGICEAVRGLATHTHTHTHTEENLFVVFMIR